MRIDDTHTIYEFSEKQECVLKIRPGDTVEFETKDCLSNVLKRPEDRLADTGFDKSRVNPATGPVFIEGAHPGDVLEIKVEKIKLKDQAVITCQENLGVFGDRFEETTFKITPVRNGYIEFNPKIKIPVKPMIGVMGVAPKGDVSPTGMLGRHGGNMDNTMIGEGITLYLPIFAEGALLAVGDVHAAMGDGEINCSAIEAAAWVTLTFNVRKEVAIENPVLINGQSFSTIAAAETLDEAVETSVKDMGRFLEERLPIAFDEITMLMSAVGETQICQIVSPLRSARYVMPRYVLDAYNITF